MSLFPLPLPASLILLIGATSLSSQTLERRSPPKPELPSTARHQELPAQPAHPALAAGTNLQVEITRHYPLRVNETVEARLLHPVFVDGKLAVPANTMVRGTVTALDADSKTRVHGRLRGDFTPYHTAEVEFRQLELPGGPLVISADKAGNGAPVVRLSAPGVTPKQSMVSRYWAQAKTQAHDRVAFFTAPGFGDRALQMLYHQLPYHPERIEAHTMWSFNLNAPLQLPGFSDDPPPAAAAPKSTNNPETWSVNALLTEDLTSANAKPGDPVRALVVEPVLDKEHQLVVPQGSVLVGRVSAAKAARSMGRNGKLRFNFQEVRFPEGEAMPNRAVEGSLSGATAGSQHGLSLDAEGTITPRNQSSVIAPLLLTVLAGRALDEDGNLTTQTGVASNGFGVIGRAVGLAAGNRDLAAGIGYYAAALSVYENFLHRGRDVVFPKNTRIEIETTPLRAPVITPGSE